MRQPPGGPDLTFVFTDVPESGWHWDRDPAAMKSWLATYDGLLTSLFEDQGGYMVRARGESEGYFCVFDEPWAAVQAATRLQLELQGSEIQVRTGMNSGHATMRDGDYYGTAVNRGARIKAMAHPSQILVSKSVVEQIGDPVAPIGFKDLGTHRLRDLTAPEQVYQVTHPQLSEAMPPIRSLDSTPNNLPIQLSSFVGREAEISSVRALLSSSRLVTLTGTGGSGKTRLALQVSADLIDGFPDGVWLVELATFRDQALVPQATLNALGLRETKNEGAMETLRQHVRSRRLLIILDNAEHLIEATADMAETLLRTSPGLQILSTSREPLGVGGEVTLRVPSLKVPDPMDLPPIDKMTDYDSVALFVARATAADRSWELTENNAVWIAQLCKRLDGIPLAIELAAARVRVLSPEQIASRLDDRFQLLSSSMRSAQPRQRTLKALVDWSYDLLSDDEKTLWRRLSVFTGGCGLEAVESVCSDTKLRSSDVLELLTQLVDKSLVSADMQGVEPRYRQLETIREYGREKLVGFGEEEPLSQRHARWFLELAERAESELWGPDQARWLELLEADRGNMRAAIGYLNASRGVIDAARIAAALWEFCEIRGHFEEGRRWLEDALSRSDEIPVLLRAKALRGAGNLAYDQGDLDAAARYHSESLEAEKTNNDPSGAAKALNNLGVVEQGRGNLDKAREHYEEALQIMRSLGDARGISVLLSNLGSIAHHQSNIELAEGLYTESLALRRQLGNKRGIAHSLNNLGNLAKERDDFARARQLYQESLKIRDELGDRSGIAVLKHNLGGCAMEEGVLELARDLYTESLRIHSELGDKKAIADSLEEFASLVNKEDDPIAAVALHGAADTLRSHIGATREAAKQQGYDEDMDSLRSLLGEEGFTAAWEKGRRMSLDEAIRFAIEQHTA